MIPSRRIVDLMIVSISAWAVIATSKAPANSNPPEDVPSIEAPVIGSFTFESNCEDSVEKSGSLKIRSSENPAVLTMENDYPIGLPANEIVKASEIETNGGSELTYFVRGDERLCLAVLEESIFAHAGTTTFSCYDNESSTVSCSVKLTLQSLEELN